MKSAEIAMRLFPQGTPGHVGVRSAEINGLEAGTEPVNCEILLKGQMRFSEERRELFLVRTPEALVFLRICRAAPGSGYAEFAVVLETEAIDSPEAKSLEEYVRSTFPNLCN